MYHDSWHLSAEGGRRLGIQLLSAGLTMDQLWGDESDGSDREVQSAITKTLRTPLNDGMPSGVGVGAPQ